MGKSYFSKNYIFTHKKKDARADAIKTVIFLRKNCVPPDAKMPATKIFLPLCSAIPRAVPCLKQKLKKSAGKRLL